MHIYLSRTKTGIFINLKVKNLKCKLIASGQGHLDVTGSTSRQVAVMAANAADLKRIS